MTGISRLASPDLILSPEDDAGVVSGRFGDIYFQPEDALAEASHVFIQGNRLPERFAALSPGQTFVVGELGFGTGLNFLATMMAFDAYAPDGAQLSFLSVEGFPLSPDELRWAHQKLEAASPALKPYVACLLQHYPRPRPGRAQRHLRNDVDLTLVFSDVSAALADPRLSVDAWFLDGFAPSKNPEMWYTDVLSRIAESLRPGGTVATFTAAGEVRRALADAGLKVERTPGFGRKRHMTLGQKDAAAARSCSSSISEVIVAGGGIAGACTAFHLKRCGLDVTVLAGDPDTPAASGNPIGLLMPRLDAGHDATAQFYRDAFLYSLAFYADVAPDAVETPGGSLMVDEANLSRYRKVLQNNLWTEQDLALDERTAALHVTCGAVLRPSRAIEKLLAGINVHGCSVLKSSPTPNGKVFAVDDQGREHFSDALIVAAGSGVDAFIDHQGDLAGSRGQLDIFEGRSDHDIKSKSSYVANVPAGWLSTAQPAVAAGATYDAVALSEVVAVDDESTAINRQAALTLGASLQRDTPLMHRAAVRTVTRDRHPVCGRLTPAQSNGEGAILYLGTDDDTPASESANAFVLTGLGSRGLSTAPILAAHLTSMIAGKPSPLGPEMTNILKPERFAERRKRRSLG